MCFLAAIWLSGVLLYAYENQITTSASKWDSPSLLTKYFFETRIAKCAIATLFTSRGGPRSGGWVVKNEVKICSDPNYTARADCLQRESSSPTRSRHETASLRFEPNITSLTLVKWARREDGIKKRSAEMADLFLMAPATGIEPITNP